MRRYQKQNVCFECGKRAIAFVGVNPACAKHKAKYEKLKDKVLREKK